MSKDEDKEFRELLADKRHKELVKGLRSIAGLLDNDSSVEVVKAIKAQDKSFEGLIKIIKNIPEPKAPIVKVEQIKIKEALDKICNDIIESNNKVIAALENRKLPKSFDLVKDYKGVTESVKVKYETAKQIK